MKTFKPYLLILGALLLHSCADYKFHYSRDARGWESNTPPAGLTPAHSVFLVGDAGHLVDPLTGEGIGNAFYSGFIAAEQLQQCLAADDFSASFLKAYDQRVSRVLGSEMRLSYRLQKMLAYPWLVNLLANIIAGNRRVAALLSGMYNDFALREQLVKPWFWMKMFFRR